MPTYAYKCSACDHTFEIFQKISAEPLRLCTACQKETVYRLPGGGSATLQFKGSGFYITDYGTSQDACGTGENTCDSCTGAGSPESSQS